MKFTQKEKLHIPYFFLPSSTLSTHGRGAVHARDHYVAQLLDAFEFGRARQGLPKDACLTLQRKCYDKKPVVNPVQQQQQPQQQQ